MILPGSVVGIMLIRKVGRSCCPLLHPIRANRTIMQVKYEGCFATAAALIRYIFVLNFLDSRFLGLIRSDCFKADASTTATSPFPHIRG